MNPGTILLQAIVENEEKDEEKEGRLEPRGPDTKPGTEWKVVAAPRICEKGMRHGPHAPHQLQSIESIYGSGLARVPRTRVWKHVFHCFYRQSTMAFHARAFQPARTKAAAARDTLSQLLLGAELLHILQMTGTHNGTLPAS